MNLPFHRAAKEAFAAYVREDRVPHAFLVAGPSGCGKLNLAREMARELLCLEGTAGGCGECRSCRLFAGGAHPDFRDITLELREKSEKLSDVIKVQQVRRLIEALYKTTTVSPRKVAVIHPAERMNASAANALLKTLEEPVGETVLILVAHDPSRLPATIRSRCQRLTIPLPDLGQAQEWLVAEQGVERDVAVEALDAAAGRPLEALELVRSGSIDQYHTAMALLDTIRAGHGSDGRATAEMAEIDPEQLWTWLSLRCASAVRKAVSGRVPGEAVRPLTGLQELANRNRLLAATPVRKDLLLRDWLIQWKNLPATLPLDRQTQEA